MTRVVKEHNERLQELLDTSMALFQQKGYDHTSVADIIDAVGIAKGTFYHYFPSKEDLLAAIVERYTAAIQGRLQDIVDNPELSAMEKLHRVYYDVGTYKLERMEQMLVLTVALYRDANRRLRDGLEEAVISGSGEYLGRIFRQGVDEGVFSTRFPEQLGPMLSKMGLYVRDLFGTVVTDPLGNADLVPTLYAAAEAYQEAVERALGARPGSILLFSRAQLEAFVNTALDMHRTDRSPGHNHNTQQRD